MSYRRRLRVSNISPAFNEPTHPFRRKWRQERGETVKARVAIPSEEKTPTTPERPTRQTPKRHRGRPDSDRGNHRLYKRRLHLKPACVTTAHARLTVRGIHTHSAAAGSTSTFFPSKPPFPPLKGRRQARINRRCHVRAHSAHDPAVCRRRKVNFPTHLAPFPQGGSTTSFPQTAREMNQGRLSHATLSTPRCTR